MSSRLAGVRAARLALSNRSGRSSSRSSSGSDARFTIFCLPSSSMVTMPSFIGQTLNDADAEVERLKLTSAVVDHTTSDRYPKGVVILQRPNVGAQVRQGRQVSFVVSDGIVARVMPDLRYQSLREVQLDLSRVAPAAGEGHVRAKRHRSRRTRHLAGSAAARQRARRRRRHAERQPRRAARDRGAELRRHAIDQARAVAAKAGSSSGRSSGRRSGQNGPRHGLVVAADCPPPKAKIASFDPVSLQVSAGPVRIGIHRAAGPRARLGAGSRSSRRAIKTSQQHSSTCGYSLTDATGKYESTTPLPSRDRSSTSW